MGQIAAISRISQATFDKVKETKKVDWNTTIETVDVYKMWEPVMFVFGKGFIGSDPFVNIFMPKNTLSETPDSEFFDEDAVRYHSPEDIIMFNKHCLDVIELFKVAAIESDVIVGSIG